MSEVIYRPYRSSDAEDVKLIMNEAFYVHRYVTGSLVIDSALELYLRERLLASTWARVAVNGGQVVGVIMGQAAGQARLSGRGKNRVLSWAHMLRAGVLGFRQLKGLRQFFAVGRVYQNLRGNVTAPLTNELTLFAVASSARGLGIGKRLYTDFLDHLSDVRHTDFYLFTDSLCTYGFYEKQGMERVAEGEMKLVLDSGKHHENLGVYLYTGATNPPRG